MFSSRARGESVERLGDGRHLAGRSRERVAVELEQIAVRVTEDGRGSRRRAHQRHFAEHRSVVEGGYPLRLSGVVGLDDRDASPREDKEALPRLTLRHDRLFRLDAAKLHRPDDPSKRVGRHLAQERDRGELLRVDLAGALQIVAECLGLRGELSQRGRRTQLEAVGERARLVPRSDPDPSAETF